MKKLTKIISVLVLLFTIFASLGNSLIETAEATGTTGDSVSVTLHKKKMLAPLPQLKQNTGEEMPHFDQYDDYTDGAEFKVYDVTAAYYGHRQDGLTEEQALDLVRVLVDTPAPVRTGTTDNTGTLSFTLPQKSGGKDAMYLFVETPKAGVTVAANMVLSFPVYAMNDAGEYTNKKLDTVHLYPKNIVSADGSLLVKKLGTADNIGLNGAEFIVKDKTTEKYLKGIHNGLFSWGAIGDAYKFITGNSYSIGSSGIVASDAALGNLIINGFEPGDYLLIETKAPDDAAMIDAHIETPFTIAADNQTAVEKIVYNDTIIIDKDHEGTRPDYNVGDSIPYSITLNIPQGMGDKVGDIYKHPSLIITDTPDDGLHFRNITSLKFDNTEITPGTGWLNTGGNGFVMTIPASALAAYAGKELTITYNMYLDGTADPDKGYSNLATVWTHLIENEDDDNPEVFTGGYKFKKVDANFSTKNALADAEFVVRNADRDDALYLNIDPSTKAVSWVATLADATIFKTAADGLINVAGLEYGTYYLEETVAPADYVLREDRIPFTVNKGSYNDTARLDVKNIRKGRLPSTGGSGIVGFIGLGAVLVASTGGYYIKRKRD